MKNKTSKFLLFAALSAGMAASAGATSYGFSKITNNNAEDLGSQLRVEVTGDADYAYFQFFNDVGIRSNIAEIYFDDGLFGPATLTDSDGGGGDVEYIIGAGPVLPGGNTLSSPFVVTTQLSSQADNPAPHNSVNAAGEWVTARFELGIFANIAAVEAAIASGDLRIGLHVTGIGADKGSDGYVNGGGSSVPDGGTTLALFGLSLLGLGGVRRLKARKA